MRWVAVLMLAGCGVRVGPPEVVLPLLADRCGVVLVDGLVGQPFVALADVALPGPLRVLYPGQEVTDEVEPARLNAAVDGEARIRRVFCG